MQAASWHDVLRGRGDDVSELKSITEVGADDLLRVFDCQCFVNGTVICVGCSRRARARHLTRSRNPLESRAQYGKRIRFSRIALVEFALLTQSQLLGC